MTTPKATKKARWSHLVSAVARDIPGFSIRYKDENRLQRLIDRLCFWTVYGAFVTTVYPIVWFPNRKYVDERRPFEILEHEWVHLKDAKTFFGWLPFLPAKLNALLFNLAYIFPWPAPFRAWAELRAYRRSIELGADVEEVVPYFTGPDYLFMLPFGRLVKRLLTRPSPYKSEMDKAGL